jgi:alkanesulfonate monooxygenase SsuD/methylene tetrahydromethanopterin reductase-like flavin-dependent oxidoreductase (luciferase family)
MNVGLYFDLRNPGGDRERWPRIYDQTLELCEEAERLGIHSLWFSEHHEFDDGYLPQPLTYAAAVAARTATVRLGTAVLLAPLRHPAQLAEEAAVVDQISNGRLELGLGAGYRRAEYELFDAPSFATRRRRTTEMISELRSFWSDGRLTPPPVQSEIPIWLGFQGPQGALRAGLAGTGLLASNPALAEPYLRGLAQGGHDVSSARMAGPIYGLISDDPEHEWAQISPHLAYQIDSYARYRAEGVSQPPAVDVEALRRRRLGPSQANFLVATPEDAAEAIRSYIGDAPVKTIFFWASMGGMPYDLTSRNVDTICRRLVPLLASSSDPSAFH